MFGVRHCGNIAGLQSGSRGRVWIGLSLPPGPRLAEGCCGILQPDTLFRSRPIGRREGIRRCERWTAGIPNQPLREQFPLSVRDFREDPEGADISRSTAE